MSAVFDILPRLHALLALLLVQAQDPQLSFPKLLRVSGTIARLTRLIIKEEIAAAHHALKTAMLSDPTWRARVIWQLGGAEALQSWRQRFWFQREHKGQGERRMDRVHGVRPGAPNYGAANRDALFRKSGSSKSADPKPQSRFRLKQPDRAFYGRRPADTDRQRAYEPKPATSRLYMPIPLLPHDFWPPRLEAKSAVSYYGLNGAVFNGTRFNEKAKPDDGQGQRPPPDYDPP